MTKGEELYISGALESAFPVLEKEAKDGAARAWFCLAQYDLHGLSHVRKHPLNASAHLARGADGDTLCFLGLHFFTQPAGEDDRAAVLSAMAEAERLAEAGDVLACLCLSYVYRVGYKEYTETNPEKGISYLEKAAEAGFWQAQNDLGLLYLNGTEVAADVSRGFSLLSAAADKGIGLSLYHLAYCYIAGLGTEVDTVLGMSLYRKAWEAGCAEAAVELGMRYESGSGVKADAAKAFRLYKKAAEEGSFEAMAHEADCRYEGKGTKADRGAAMKLYQRAADAGDGYAMVRLGQIDFEKQKFKSAFSYFLQSARKGLPVAQYFTGVCLLRGLGVGQNSDVGIKWLMQAAQNGSRDAAEALQQLLPTQS